MQETSLTKPEQLISELVEKASTMQTGERFMLGIVGYPGDKNLSGGSRAKDEAGAQMYEQFSRTTYEIATSRRNMVEYQISTFGGEQRHHTVL